MVGEGAVASKLVTAPSLRFGRLSHLLPAGLPPVGGF